MRWSGTASSAGCARRSSSVQESLPRGRDFVLIARPGLGEAAEANGFEWLGERVSEVFRLAEGADRGARA